MKFGYMFFVPFLFFTAKANAYSVCHKQNADCLLYAELNKDSGYDLYFKDKLLVKFDWYASTRWDVLKKENKYFFSQTSGIGDPSADIYVYQLSFPCESCAPEITRGRYMSVNRQSDFNQNGSLSNLDLQGVEKVFKQRYGIADSRNAHQGLLGKRADFKAIKRIGSNRNAFYIALFSRTDDYLGERVLYSPPTTKDEINPLLISCITNCEFGDDALQVENKSYTFFGDINEKIAIKLELKKQGSRISGQYCYLKNCKDYIALNGSINASGDVDLEESVNKKVTGRMVFKSEGKNSFLGEWVSAAGKKMPLFIAREE